MVGRSVGPSSSRARLVAAAEREFAARGFDGAKVDRIAALARVNKAMLYYHFADKAALYREILRDVFGTAAEAVEAVRDAGGSPETQVRGFVSAIAHSAVARPHFPAIWLREMAEGGRHLDAAVVDQLGRVMRVLAGMLTAGRRQGVFRAVDPLVAQMSIVAPLLLFRVSAPMRARFQKRAPYPVSGFPSEVIVEHVQAATLASLCLPARPVRRRVPRTRSVRS